MNDVDRVQIANIDRIYGIIHIAKKVDRNIVVLIDARMKVDQCVLAIFDTIQCVYEVEKCPLKTQIALKMTTDDHDDRPAQSIDSIHI